MSSERGITLVSGISVGHWTEAEAATGCTVVLCPEGAVASVDVRGGAPGTRNTDLLGQGNTIQQIHGILLTGGSEFGLEAAGGVVRWLEERGYGFPTTVGPVPIVAAAVIFDLTIGRADVRPGAEAGYAACEAAGGNDVGEGSVGAGTGATVGKALLTERALKGGVGSAAETTASGITVGALAVVNCWGEVIDPDTGEVIAGPRGEAPGEFVGTVEQMRKEAPLSPFLAASQNTTLGVVATDAVLTKDDARRLAVMAQAGLARCIRPAHSPVDGDTVFGLATGRNETATDLLQLGTLGARAMERAVVRAVREAEGLAGVPSAGEWVEARGKR
jgi:L-aminopeptidase/D-esterase-like protein